VPQGACQGAMRSTQLSPGTPDMAHQCHHAHATVPAAAAPQQQPLPATHLCREGSRLVPSTVQSNV
jgi:hypothetical protein